MSSSPPTTDQAGISRLNRTKTYWALVVIMAAGFVLRVWELGITPFNIDEAAVSVFANTMAKGRGFALSGMKTSFGFHNPPLFIYMMTPFYLFTEDPRFAMLGMAMFGTAAIGLTGLSARRLWGGWTALLAAAIVCFSPTAIDHSRRLWGHDTIIFWSALAIYATIRGIQYRRDRWLAVALGAAACGQACHLSGALLWLFPVGAIVLYRPERWRHTLAIGAAILALIYLPWLIDDSGILSQSGSGSQTEEVQRFDELLLIARVAMGAAEGGAPKSTAPSYVSWITQLADAAYSDMLYKEYGRFLDENPAVRLLLWASTLVLGLGLIAALSMFVQALRKQPRASRTSSWALLLGISILAPVVLFTALPVTVVPPYQLPAFVPSALAVAWLATRPFEAGRGLSWGVQRRARLRPAGAALGLGLAFLMVGFGISYTIAQRQFVAAATFEHEVIPAIRFKIDIITEIVATADDRAYAIMQNGRTIEDGVDYWVLYLHYYISGDDRAPTLRAAPVVYVIVDGRKPLRAPVQAVLDEYAPIHESGNLRLYRFSGREATQWHALTERYPSA